MRSQRHQPLITALRNFITLVSIISTILIFLTISMFLLGIRPFILTSDSMAPTYTKGSLIFVDTHASVKDATIGDVIVYRGKTGAMVMHRRVGKHLLKGDSNARTQRKTLSQSNFVGKPLLAIPYLGYGIKSVLNKPWIMWIASIAMFVLACIPWSSFKKDSSFYRKV